MPLPCFKLIFLVVVLAGVGRFVWVKGCGALSRAGRVPLLP